MKRVLTVASILFVVAAIITAGVIFLKKEEEKKISAMRFVPIDAAFIIKSNSFTSLINTFRTNNAVWKELRSIDVLKNFNVNLTYLDSLFRSNEKLNVQIANAEVLVSAFQMSKGSVDLLYHVTFQEDFSKQKFAGVISSLAGEENVKEIDMYEGLPLFNVKLKNNTYYVAFSAAYDLMMLSSNSILLQEAVRQLKSDVRITDMDGFKRVQNTEKGRNVDANIYINLKNFASMAAKLTCNRYQNKASSSLNVAEWGELDLTSGENVVSFNGFLNANDTLKNALSVFRGQSPQKMNITRIIPASTAFLISFGIGDIQKYEEAYTSLLKRTKTFELYMLANDSINKICKTDVRKAFLSFIENEMAVVYTQIESLRPEENVFAIFGTKTRSGVSDILLTIIDSIAAEKNKSRDKFLNIYNFDAEQKYEIYELPLPSLPSKLFGNVFKHIKTPYFTFVDNYLVFGNSAAALSRFIQLNVLNKNLANDLNFNYASEYFSSRSNVFIYTDLLYVNKLHSEYLSDNMFAMLNDNPKVFQKVRNAGIQINTNDDLFYTNMFFLYSPNYYEKAQTIWETLLDTVSDFKPQLVVNHNTDEYEIFTQDANNNIYLINSAGRILWKFKIQGKILGMVYQADCYKNNKLQLLFNTEDKLYLVDRNGNNVKGFPVELRSNAVKGLTLCDFNDKKDYSIYIPCNDKKVYCYKIDGTLSGDWKFKKAENNIVSDVKNFVVDKNNYLVFADTYKMYILNSKGEQKINLDQYFQKSANGEICFDKNSQNIITTDISGNVYFINNIGKTKKLHIDDFMAGHFFESRDLNGDSEPELIFIDGYHLKVYSSRGQKIFSYTFDFPVTVKPYLFEFAFNDNKIGVLEKEGNSLFLFNNDGNLYNAFPLRGNTMFSIGKLNDSLRFNLIAGNNSNFLQNYSVK